MILLLVVVNVALLLLLFTLFSFLIVGFRWFLFVFMVLDCWVCFYIDYVLMIYARQ